MNELINQNEALTIDSREVAEMTGKEHSKLMRDIRGYAEILKKSANPNLDSPKFFIQSEYTDSQNKQRPCYLLTRKGCNMVANKMTGEKGVLFTATYVTKFEEMERELQKPQFKLPTTYKEALLQLVEAEEEKERLNLVIAEQKPKVDKYNEFLDSDGCINVSQIAKILKMPSAIFLNKKLAEMGLQYRKGSKWLPYATTNLELFKLIPVNYGNGLTTQLKWTSKLVDLLSNEGK